MTDRIGFRTSYSQCLCGCGPHTSREGSRTRHSFGGVRSLSEPRAKGYQKATGLRLETMLTTGPGTQLSGQPVGLRFSQQLALPQLGCAVWQSSITGEPFHVPANLNYRAQQSRGALI